MSFRTPSPVVPTDTGSAIFREGCGKTRNTVSGRLTTEEWEGGGREHTMRTATGPTKTLAGNPAPHRCGTIAANVERVVDTTPSSAPTAVFISERKHGQSQKNLAFFSTGRSRTTKQITIGVGVRHRRNGIVNVDLDLWRIDYDLSQDAIDGLCSYWHQLNVRHRLPTKMIRKLEGFMGRPQFSATFVSFNCTSEQAEEWKDFLAAVLSNRASYIDIRARNRLALKLDRGR